MSGRHRYEPNPFDAQPDDRLSGTDGYTYHIQAKQFHDNAISGWDKQPGIHRNSTASLPLGERALVLTLAALQFTRHPYRKR